MGDRTAVVIEDDPDIRDLLRTVLTQSGFDTVAASNGIDGIEAVRAHQPVVTTLDVAMPGMDGFAVASQLREFSDTYIIMLTGQTDEIDVIQGLQSGADDYLTKPFRPRELRVRIEALLRRPRAFVADGTDAAPAVEVPKAETSSVVAADAAPMAPQPPAPPQQPIQPPPPAPVLPPPPPPTVGQAPVEPVVSAAPSAAETTAPTGPTVGPHSDQAVYTSDGLVLDAAARTVSVDGRWIDLTRSEFDLLAALLESRRRVRSKADLVLMLRGESYVTTYYVTDADKRAVEVHMANLRRKIGDSSTTPRWIETVRGVGYRLATS